MTTRVDISVKKTNAPSGQMLVGTMDGADFSGSLMKPPFTCEMLVWGDTKVVVKEASAADVAAQKAA